MAAEASVAAVPAVGQPAPASPELGLPRAKPTLVVFLRQCDDPFAEKTFRNLAALSEDRPELLCIAVSQAARDVTDAWVAAIGGAWEVEVVADPERALFPRWGLGLNTSWQMFNPRALYSTYALGRDEGIWSRTWGGQRKAALPAAAAASLGNKWQMGGAFAVDQVGIVHWAHVPAASDDIADFNPALQALNIPPVPPKPVRRPPSPKPVAIPDGQRALYQTPTPR